MGHKTRKKSFKLTIGQMAINLLITIENKLSAPCNRQPNSEYTHNQSQLLITYVIHKYVHTRKHSIRNIKIKSTTFWNDPWTTTIRLPIVKFNSKMKRKKGRQEL